MTPASDRRRLRRLRRAAGLLALGCAPLFVGAAACQPSASRVVFPADSAAGEVAFDLAGPAEAALVVPVHVNGEGPFDFILDTGATITCVADSTAVGLGLRESTGTGAVGVGVGGSGRLRLSTVDSLRLGDARAYDLPVCLVDLSQTRVLGHEVHGLLGLNFLKPYRVTVDFHRRVVRLEPGGEAREAPASPEGPPGGGAGAAGAAPPR